MKALKKRTNINELQTVEAYESVCVCSCPSCSCAGGILWISDTNSANNEAKGFAGGVAFA